MMTLTKWTLALWLTTALLLLMTTTTALAAPPATALSLQQVIELATQQAPDVAIAEAQIAVAQAQKERAEAGFMPSIGLSSSIAPGVQITVPLLSNDTSGLCSAGNLACSVGAAPVGSARAGASVDARWRVFDFGATAAGVDERDAALSATRARLQGTTARTVGQAVKIFLAVVADDELVTVRARLAADRQQQADSVQARADLGDGALADTLQARVAAEAAAFDLEVAVVQARVDRLALLGALGLAVDADATIAIDGTTALDIVPADDHSTDANTHPDVRAAAFDAQGAQRGVASAELGLWPTIDASASAGAQMVALTKPDANLTPSAGVGVSFAWPLLDLGRSADVRQARASQLVSETSRRARSIAVATEQARAHALLTAQTALVSRASRLRDSAQQAVDVVTARVAGGAGRLSDLLDAQAALTQAEATLVNARAARAAAVVDVAVAAGVVDGGSFR